MADRDPVTASLTNLKDRLARIIAPGQRAALIGFPKDQNCGKYANWLGSRKLLSGLGAQLTCAAAFTSVESQKLGAEETIVISSDIFTDRSAAAALAQYAGANQNPIVLLPQSASGAAPIPALSTMAARANVVIFARDPVSKSRIEQAIGGKFSVEIAPPATFALEVQPSRAEPEYDILWIARTGKGDSSAETAARLLTQSAEKLDLPRFPDSVEMDVVVKRRPPTVLLTDWSSLVFRTQEARLTSNTLDPGARAQGYLDRALHILSLGRVIITDRTGAHILSLLLGKPHVFSGNPEGTNRAFFDAWSAGSHVCQFAENPAKAWTLARAMLHEIKPEI